MYLAFSSDTLSLLLTAGPEVVAKGTTREAAVIRPEVQNGVASIAVKGPLLKQTSWIHDFLGIEATTYPALSSAVKLAEADPRVSSIDLVIESPGGTVEGLFEFLDDLDGTTKTTRAVVSDLCCSAAYAIAAACDSIVATNEAAIFGSIGVVQTHFKPGGSAVNITSTNAPNKRPDVSTPEGVAHVRSELDQIETLFVERVAAGRGVSSAEVVERYGRGGCFTAREAKARGMVDAVGRPALSQSSPQGSAPAPGATEGSNHMELTAEQIRAQFPALCDELREEGKRAERKRVEEHATLGLKSGDLSLALEGIKSGAVVDFETMQKHATASVAGKALAARVEEAAAAASTVASVPVALDETKATEASSDLDTEVSAILDKMRFPGRKG